MSDESEYGRVSCRAPNVDAMDFISKTSQSGMNGKGTETDKIYACSACGARWCKTVESGFGVRHLLDATHVMLQSPPSTHSMQ